MDMTKLVEVTSDVLLKIGFAGLPINARVVRFYAYEGIIPKPTKKGRSSYYDESHVKAIVLVRLLQAQGLSIASIQKELNNAKLEPSVSKLIEDLVSSVDAAAREEESSQMPRKKTMIPKFRRHHENVVRKPKQPVTAWANNEEVLSYSITNSLEFGPLQPYVTLGSAFAFINDVPDGELAKSIHRLLYGQKSGSGQVRKAVLFADESGLALPGVTITGKKVQGDGIRAIIPDKGVYEEGDGVASLFVFDPSAANGKKEITITLDGSLLDRMEAKLDANGCALVRVPTFVSGKYEATITGTTAMCSFETARYELVPFSVSVSNMEKADGKLALTLEAETYGEPYEGVAIARVRGRDQECKFHEGLGRASFDIGDCDGEMEVVLVNKEDPSLVASAPLTGTKKHERSDTTVCSMGRVVSVSMVKTPQSVGERGLFFDEGAYTNTPIAVESCIASKVVLRTSAAVEEMVVVLRDPVSGKSITKEFGKRKANTSVSVEFDFPFALVHVGAFVNGEAWEGTAVVAKPSGNKVELSAPSQVSPGESVKIGIKVDGKASVLLKVRDRRVKAHYEPMSAIASSAKAWLALAIGNRQTGLARGVLQALIAKGGILRSMGGLYAPEWTSVGARGMTFGARSLVARDDDNIRYMMDNSSHQASYKSSNDALSAYSAPDDALLCSTQGAVPVSMTNAGLDLDEPVGAAYYNAVEVKTAGLVALQDCVMGRPRKAKEHAARQSSSDLVYCDLLQVDGKASVEIRLPDSVALYDVKAFSVQGADWAEAETAIRAEKETYIEPLFPKVAEAESGVKCRAVLVRTAPGSRWALKVNGKPFLMDKTESSTNGNVHLKWEAVPGSHDLTLYSPEGEAIDRVIRVVEAPGEETVLAQEMRILKKGQSYDLSQDDALSVIVLPGMESELTVAVQVLTDFQYSCCEQTSAKIAAAAMAVFTGDDSSKSKGYEGLVKGEARMKLMYTPKGFMYYPNGSLNEWASKCAANRLSHVCSLLKDSNLPADARRAVDSLSSMSSTVVKEHGVGGYDMDGKVAKAYYENKKVAVGEATALADGLGGQSRYNTPNVAEAAYAVACLVRQGDLEAAIECANKVAKAMQGTMGGGWHGTCESLAYMYMVCELTKAGVVPGADGEAKVDGKKTTIEKATRMRDISTVAALYGAVAIKISRLVRIDLSAANSNVGISIDLIGLDGHRDIRAGKRAQMTVKLTDGYQQGDVLCVVLPDCLSRMVGGAKAKKFSIDFSGRKEVEIELVAHAKTDKPQRFGAVVRNMYDASRLGSVGLMAVGVK